MTPDEFRSKFRELTGNRPLLWQERLFNQFINEPEKLPSVIDLPTGLGKTMVMAIWLIARMEEGSPLPRRLIYVVDRRTVVDQATDLATILQRGDDKTLKGIGVEKLAISTLRGQLADNREWSRDPGKLAIIIGTVDLIGSALLFSGYRSSYKQRPLEAGLLGQDSLLVLDEAHLSKPFEKLITSISRFQSGQGLPMRVIRMSATTSAGEVNRFKLEPSDLADVTIDERFTAKKWLTIYVKESVDPQLLANEAIKLATDLSLNGKRIVVFVRRPDTANAVAKLIRAHETRTEGASGKKPATIKTKPYEESVEVLTGTMRGLERDELLDKAVLKRFLAANDPSASDATFLISTSAGEVGFDLNADHLVGDAAPLDSWIQRLGRVNRRGKGNASISLILARDPADKTDMEKACIAASKLFVDGMDVSPQAIAGFKLKLLPEQLIAASTPEPTTVELTDILLDAWGMTSIIEPMPGRPPVAPWLRGISDEPPQTTIAWRAELDQPGFDQLGLDEIEEWFDTHRILTHEALSVPTDVAAKWFLERWDALDPAFRDEIATRPCVIDRAGLRMLSMKDLISELNRKYTDSIRNADVILPASFGGIERHVGLLDASAPKKPEDPTDTDGKTRQNNGHVHHRAPDVADERGDRRREIQPIGDDVQPPEPLTGPPIDDAVRSTHAKFALDLSIDEDVHRLVSYVLKRDKFEWGTKPQFLHDYNGEHGHVERVRHYANLIVKELGLQSNDPVRQVLELAADWHDEGKKRERWQRCVGRKPDEPPLGKSGGKMLRDSRGYRHEFGSLREFIDAHQNKVTQDVFDLAMHLIATHHGRGRPHFPKGGFDPDAESRSTEIHTDSIRRFARLQRKYGHWHLAWLENLLRCADAMASSEQDAAGGGR